MHARKESERVETTNGKRGNRAGKAVEETVGREEVGRAGETERNRKIEKWRKRERERERERKRERGREARMA